MGNANMRSTPGSGGSPIDLTLVVPVHNECHRFSLYAPHLVAFVSGYSPASELVFVDDGSTDGTPELVQRFVDACWEVRARLVRREHEGKGAAVAAGLESATTSTAAFCDVDLATPLPELARLVDAASASSALVIASRGTAASRITQHQELHRELLGRAYNRLVQLTLTPGVVDTQCGAKAAATDTWRTVLRLCCEEGFAWDVEVIAAARALGVPVQEIGVEWQHRDGTRVHLLRDGLRMVRAIPRIRRHLRRARRNGALRPAGNAQGGGRFDDETAEWFMALDPLHWWLRSKAMFVSLLIRRYARAQGWLVDVGAGPADVTALLGWAPDRTLAFDGNEKLARAMRARHVVTPAVSDAARLPAADRSASVVCMLDVLEQLPDPVPAIREALRVLRADGRLVVNVPAHPALWSEADEVLGHERRYTVASLRSDVSKAGGEVVWMSHVFSWLVVPVWWRRRVFGKGEPRLGIETTGPFVDRLAMLLTRIEWLVVSRRPLRFGTSILCVVAPSERDGE
jgi:dolichyl-phosphate beta-glucosyltransferase